MIINTNFKVLKVLLKYTPKPKTRSTINIKIKTELCKIKTLSVKKKHL